MSKRETVGRRISAAMEAGHAISGAHVEDTARAIDRAMTDRDRLIEVMALAHAGCETTSAWAGNRWEKIDYRRVAARNARMSAALAAAERAGFEFRMTVEKQ